MSDVKIGLTGYRQEPNATTSRLERETGSLGAPPSTIEEERHFRDRIKRCDGTSLCAQNLQCESVPQVVFDALLASEGAPCKLPGYTYARWHIVRLASDCIIYGAQFGPSSQWKWVGHGSVAVYFLCPTST